MYIAYTHPMLGTSSKGKPIRAKSNLQLRRNAYRHICKKYEQEIEAIRQHQPGWMPRF